MKPRIPTSLRVIVVEDEPKLRENLIIGLTHQGFDVRGAANGVELDVALALKPADVIVLDLGLPGEDGIEIARRIRKRSLTGLIMVTARGMTEDRREGFESGADLYFVKPVDMVELASAIKNLGHRIVPSHKPQWRLDNDSSSLISPNDIGIRLNSQEFSLLALLLSKTGEDVERSSILNALGMPDDVSFYPRLEVLISRLRSKTLKADPEFPIPIQTRYSRGYTFLMES